MKFGWLCFSIFLSCSTDRAQENHNISDSTPEVSTSPIVPLVNFQEQRSRESVPSQSSHHWNTKTFFGRFKNGKSLARAGLTAKEQRIFQSLFKGNIEKARVRGKKQYFRLIIKKTRSRDRSEVAREILVAEHCIEDFGFKRAFLFSAAEKGVFYDRKGREIARFLPRYPVPFRGISSPYDSRRFHPILKKQVAHLGVDFIASAGEPVVSIRQGTITFAEWKNKEGNLVIVRHSNGVESWYGHLQEFAPGIRKRSRVKAGQVLGFVGSTGLSTGPHLHFGLKVRGRFVDPLRPIENLRRSLRGKNLARFRKSSQSLVNRLESTKNRSNVDSCR